MKKIIVLSTLLFSSILWAYGDPSGEVTEDLSVEPVPVAESSVKSMDDLTPDQLGDLLEEMKMTGEYKDEPPKGQQYAGPGKGGRVKGVTACNPKDGKYYFTVTLNGKFVFKALTSPGKFSTPTRIKWGNKITRAPTRDHVTSKNTSYPGVPMPCSVWIGTDKGYATHGTTNLKNLGYPDSHGCMRLTKANACRYFDLVEENGRNASTHFAGYDDRCYTRHPSKGGKIVDKSGGGNKEKSGITKLNCVKKKGSAKRKCNRKCKNLYRRSRAKQSVCKGIGGLF